MKTYVLSYVQRFSNAVEDTLLWKCEAEDFGHACEQLFNAEEGVVSVSLKQVAERDSEQIFTAA